MSITVCVFEELTQLEFFRVVNLFVTGAHHPATLQHDVPNKQAPW